MVLTGKRSEMRKKTQKRLKENGFWFEKSGNRLYIN